MKQFRNILPYILAIAILLAVILNIFLALDAIGKQKEELESVKLKVQTMQKLIESTPIPTNGIDGYTPVKNIDYFDGKNGLNGKDSISTNTIQTIVKEVPIAGEKGDNGENGLTPELRCNIVKNRWEVRYSGSNTSWKVLNGEPVKCTIGE